MKDLSLYSGLRWLMRSGGLSKLATVALTANILSGCGGGGSSGPLDNDRPIVAAIDATPVMYAEPATIRVTGERLNPDMRVRLTGACTGEPVPVSSSPTLIEIQCTPNQLGFLHAEVVNGGGSDSIRRSWTIEAPIVELLMGLPESPIRASFALDLGPLDSPQRSWVDLFLFRLREGEYDNTVFHQILGGVRIEGGCYLMSGNPSFPSAGPWIAPPFSIEQRLVAPNSQYTISMSSARCRGVNGEPQAGIFAINLADNSGQSLTTIDDKNYVVIGRLIGETAKGMLNQFSNQETLPSAPSPAWPMPFPAAPDAATLRSIQRLR